MTREEAIYVLKNTAWLGSEELVGDVSEAIQMAVNALKRSKTPNSSDVISRQAAIGAANRADYRGLTVEDVKKVTDEVVKELKNLPSAQPEIVRCKDCKFSHMTINGECKYCDIWFPDEKCYMSGDYYCGSAERREE